MSDDGPQRVVVRYSVGEFPDGSLAIKFFYVTSIEQHDRGQPDEIVFEMDRDQASALGTALRRRAAATDRRRPH